MDARAEPNPPVKAELPLLTRLWFAWVCFFQVLFSGLFAARVWALRQNAPALPESKQPEAALPPPAAPPPPSPAPALQLLALLQREGRLVDFLKQDIAAFSDGEVGAAARIVHEGCRKALANHVEIDPIRSEPEGGVLELPEGYDPNEVKLTGQVEGHAPYRGVLRHRGWRAKSLELPVPVDGFNPSVLAPAEVEL